MAELDLEVEPVLEGEAEGGDRGFPVGSDAALGVARDVVGELKSAGDGGARRHHLLRQAP